MAQLSQFISRHWELCLLFFVILLITLAYEWLSQKKKAQSIAPQTAVDWINNENALVFDLRDKEAFKKGHIIDALNGSAEDFSLAKMNKYKDKPVILVCARGLDSSGVATKIKALGFQPLILQGGITAWQEAELPLIKGN